ncbi:HAD family hydrolase [Formosa sediminum]|uniref:HAD family hydrolase n=1 Tax=Formosa sediminum TaxID=2594004 RepID=A0A516GPG7_9FLAO|nr:HAD family hydrolase [Formosa sediminum]QDO93250.1 HAD family hydrolase [Formosa sediminum]
MSLNDLKIKLDNKYTKVLFSDYYDTIIHRTVHPNYTLKLWAKYMIIELGLDLTYDALYFIRQEALAHLCEKLKKNNVEIPYEILIGDVFIRLVNSNYIDYSCKSRFFELFETIDFKTESSVQYINEDVVNTIKTFKSKGGKVYLVSDFYGSKSLFEKLLQYHGISTLFDDIFSSSMLQTSKHAGTLYKTVLETLLITNPSEVVMIGDNQRSDYDNAITNKLNAHKLPHDKYLKQNRLNALGNDFKSTKKVINTIYKKSKKKDIMPFTQYIIYYHFFIERLYIKCKKERVKNLFFLAREGQFLKQIFDSYQEFHLIDTNSKINTHYLKTSRQASIQINLEPLETEPFLYLKDKYPELSIADFLIFFNCPESTQHTIIKALNISANAPIKDFFKSEVFEKLKQNETFIAFYKTHRETNRNSFNAYINAFGVDIEKEGIYLVDIGWGGTMQESLYGFYKSEIPVTGYYLGLRYIYNIQEKTKRDGLIFSILPFTSYTDYLLMANNQYYEQFSAANHGSAVEYTDTAKYVIEKHNPEEKWLYETYIETHQKQMLGFHQELLKNLETVCYDQNMIQQIIAKIALKTGLFYNKKTLQFIDSLNSGFYQNIGTNTVGLKYEKQELGNPISYLITFIKTPEVVFRYVTKLKPVLYQKNKILAFLTPSYFIYLYYLLNKFIRFSILKPLFLLKYTYFKNN